MIGDDPHGHEIVDFFERFLPNLHLPVYGEEVLGTPGDLRHDARLFKLGIEYVNDACDIGLTILAFFCQQTHQFLGMIHLDDIRPYLFEPAMHHAVLTGQLMNTRVKTVSLYDDLAEVLQKMDDGGIYSMPVVSDNRFQGMISKATLLDQYRKELMVQTGRF